MGNSNIAIQIPAADLRKSVKKTLIDLDLDREGSYDLIIPRLSEAVGREIKKSTLSMALTGTRSGQAYQQLLEKLQDVLATWPSKNEGSPVLPV